MKKIYTFTQYKEIEVEEPKITKDEKGVEVKTLIKVKKKEPYNYFFGKASRAQREESELYYNEIFWRCQQKGIAPAALMQKRYLNDGGVLSEEEKKEYHDLYEQLLSKQVDYQGFLGKATKTDEDKKKIEELSTVLVDIMGKIQTFENQAQSSLYQNTAEHIARNRTAFWWMLNLSYKENAGKEEPLFGNGDIISKFVAYDKLEELEEPFTSELLQKLLLVASLWYFGKAEKQDEFEMGIKMAQNKGLLDLASTPEEVKEEVKK